MRRLTAERRRRSSRASSATKVVASELVTSLGVSKDTVRRDLRDLASKPGRGSCGGLLAADRVVHAPARLHTRRRRHSPRRRCRCSSEARDRPRRRTTNAEVARVLAVLTAPSSPTRRLSRWRSRTTRGPMPMSSAAGCEGSAQVAVGVGRCRGVLHGAGGSCARDLLAASCHVGVPRRRRGRGAREGAIDRPRPRGDRARDGGQSPHPRAHRVRCATRDRPPGHRRWRRADTPVYERRHRRRRRYAALATSPSSRSTARWWERATRTFPWMQEHALGSGRRPLGYASCCMAAGASSCHSRPAILERRSSATVTRVAALVFCLMLPLPLLATAVHVGSILFSRSEQRR